MCVYLDCAATTPLAGEVDAIVLRFLREEFGNAGSRTHDRGLRARRAVEAARGHIATAAGAKRGEVVFTSGATESNNLAILGLAEHGLRTGRTHVVSTRIEHHAVLGPLEALERRGFSVTLVPPTRGGWVMPGAVCAATRPDTLLVSVMHVNNETGVVQPIEGIADALRRHDAYLHVDAAQSFGTMAPCLRDPRIDLISISAHKIHGPKGVGALIARRRAGGGGERPPLAPLMYGGGQEMGLRPGTLPVHLIAGFGKAAELAAQEAPARAAANRAFRRELLEALAPLEPLLVGDQDRVVPSILNLSFPVLDSERVIEALAGIVEVSSGAACTSQSYTCSHVLGAMGVDACQAEGAVRFSWCHMTERVDWARVVEAIRKARA